MQKLYPNVVRLRQWMVWGGAIFISSIVFIIAFNLTHLFHTNSEKDNAPLRLADESDKWYQNQTSAPAKKSPETTVTSQVNMQPITVSPVKNTQNPVEMPAKNNQQDPLTPQNDGVTQTLEQINSSNANGYKNTTNKEAMINNQNSNAAFVEANQHPNENYLSSSLQKPISSDEIKAGTYIPALLLTGLNSELFGQISGQVRENVYDTVTGNHLLIPQGTKLLGTYSSQIAYGQERVQVVWNRMILPNGESIDLQGMVGSDAEGYSGFHDETNNHYGKILSGVLISSLLSAGAQLSQPQQQFNNNNPLSVEQTIASSVGINIANTGNNLVQKNINLSPTNEIRPGYKFIIEVSKDIVLKPYAG